MNEKSVHHLSLKKKLIVTSLILQYRLYNILYSDDGYTTSDDGGGES